MDEYYTEEYAPNIVASLNQDDYTRIRNVNDGHIYTLIELFDFPPINSWMLRSDWLEALNMEVPTDWNGWLELWRAVRDNDVNGDGDASNEIPIAGDQFQLMPSFGILPDSNNYFCVMPDGSYGLVFDHPNYELYLTSMQQLYEEKLLDQEFATRDMSAKYKVVDANLGFSMMAAAEQSKLSSQVLRETIPEATMLCVSPPTGPNGDQYIPARGRISGLGVASITVAAEDKAADIVRLFDWLYSEEGAKLMNYGVEGVHHEIVDGKPKLLEPYVDSFVEARGAGLIFQPIPFLWLEDNYMQILLTGKEYEELDELTKNFYDGLFLNEPYFQQSAPTLVTDAYTRYGADVLPLVMENQANVIAGRMSMEEFKAQYETLKGQGLQDIIDEAKTAWETINQ